MSNFKSEQICPIKKYASSLLTATITGVLLFVTVYEADSHPVSINDIVESNQFQQCLMNPKCKLSDFKVAPINSKVKTEKGLIPPVQIENKKFKNAK